jgi:N-acetylneuraminate synthase
VITVERAQPGAEDARLVMEWRNDPTTLEMFFHHEPKRWESFEAEFAGEYFRYPELPPLFALSDGQRVAFLRFTPAEAPRDRGRRCCDVSINVAPLERGKGHGTGALRAALPVLRAAGYDDAIALIRVENSVSRRSFERAGFAFLDEIDHRVEDTGELCRVARYMAALTDGFFTNGRVFVIAEAGSNWRAGSLARDLERARALIDVGAEAGADAVKFQTYRAETVYVGNAGSSDYLSEAGITQDISDIFRGLEMPYDLIPELAAYCDERGVQFMSTPFSVQDFEALDPYVRIHKCASYENGHLRLLERFARSGKPLVMSTGASTEDDIAWAVDTFHGAEGRGLCLAQCTARYPAPLDSLRLETIPWLKRRFGVMVGFSDHSLDPIVAPIAAVALGARVIEKHFTLDRGLPGPDHAFAVTPPELKRLVDGVRAAEETLGGGAKVVLPVERELADYARRGVQAIRPIGRGEVLEEGVNVDALRPGKQRLGVHPRHLPLLQGKRSQRDIPAGDGLRSADWGE